MDKKKKKISRFSISTQRKILTYVILFLGAFLSLIPFIWMISTSFKSLGEALGTAFFPSTLRF